MKDLSIKDCEIIYGGIALCGGMVLALHHTGN